MCTKTGTLKKCFQPLCTLHNILLQTEFPMHSQTLFSNRSHLCIENYTSSVPLFLVHSTLKNRSEAKIPSILMVETPAETSFYYLLISHYSLAIASLIKQ